MARRYAHASLLIAALALSACHHRHAARGTDGIRTAVVRSTFIFEGTVLESGNTREPDYLGRDENTYIVKVDKVRQSDARFKEFEHQDVTVRILPTSPVRRLERNRQFLFLTSPLVIARTLAVQGEATNINARTSDPVDHRQELLLQERIRLADTVVRGRVTAVRPAEGNNLPAGEHDPKWNQATLFIEAYAKKLPGQRSISVRFPTSRDIVWHLSPRFNPESSGIWILQRFEEEPRQRGKLKREKTNEFTALHPLDYLSGSRDLPPQLRIRLKELPPQRPPANDQAVPGKVAK